MCSTPAKHLLQMQPCDVKIRFAFAGSMNLALDCFRQKWSKVTSKCIHLKPFFFHGVFHESFFLLQQFPRIDTRTLLGLDLNFSLNKHSLHLQNLDL